MRTGTLICSSIVLLAGCSAGSSPTPPEYAAGVGTLCDDNLEAVIFQPPEGGTEDWTALFESEGEMVGGTIVLTRAGTLVFCEGDWTVDLVIDGPDITIAGAGQSYTRLRPGGSTALSVERDVVGIEVRDLTITPDPEPPESGLSAMVLDVGSEAALSDLTLRDLNAKALIIYSNARLTGQRIAVTDNSDSGAGQGLVQIWQGATVEFSQSTFTGNRGLAMLIWYQETTVDLVDCVFSDNIGDTAGAIEMYDGPTVTVSSSEFTNNLPADVASDGIVVDVGSDGALQCSEGSCD